MLPWEAKISKFLISGTSLSAVWACLGRGSLPLIEDESFGFGSAAWSVYQRQGERCVRHTLQLEPNFILNTSFTTPLKAFWQFHEWCVSHCLLISSLLIICDYLVSSLSQNSAEGIHTQKNHPIWLPSLRKLYPQWWNCTCERSITKRCHFLFYFHFVWNLPMREVLTTTGSSILFYTRLLKIIYLITKGITNENTPP